MNITDEEFMADLDKEHPDFDWDSFDPASYPDVWKISAKAKTRRHWLPYKDKPEHDTYYTCGWEIGKEFESEEAAKKRIEEIKNDPKQNGEHLLYDYSQSVMPHIDYITIDFDTVRIYPAKSSEIQDLGLKKVFREDILAGKKVFPLYLP